MTTRVLPVKIDRGSGPAVVLLHGLGNNHRSWSYVYEKCPPSIRVIALDLLGFGDAPKPKLKYTPSDHADAVIATLEKLKLSEVVLAGHSMGCIIAIEVAAKRPDLVKQLVLAGAPLYDRQPIRRWYDKLLRSQGLYFALFEVIAKNPDALQVSGKLADDLVPFVRGMEITDETWPAFRASLEHTIMQYATLPKLSKIKTPTLFLNGVLDFFIIRRNARHAARRNPRFIHVKTVLGPHELTPYQGRRVARILARYAKKTD